MRPVTPALAKRKDARVPLEALSFEASFVRDLPADPVLTNVPRQVSNAAYTRVDPTPVAAPRLVATGEAVIRDMFYDGHPEPEPGAVVCRVAPSFVRFGNFQILAAHGETDELKRLADYVIREHYPGFDYQRFFNELCRRTA